MNEIKKPNDILVSTLTNGKAEVQDLISNGINVNNTQLLDPDSYRNLPFVKRAFADEKGNFREDLYHRLSVIIIHVPPLAERKDDIPLLVNHFIQLICNENGMPVRPISDDAVELLAQQPWTGNIRELRNVVERLLILGGSTISKEDVMSYAIGFSR